MNDFPALTTPDWMLDALCRQTGPDDFMWFPGEDEGNGIAAAKRLCERCPAREACLQYALDNNEQHGVWGALTYKQRHALKEAS